MTFSNQHDTIDSREIIERLEELRASDELTEDEREELSILEALESEASASPDWEYGETLIRDSYFLSYAQEIAEEFDLVPSTLKWPLSCIDWDRAARDLQHDYFLVEFDGIDYWIRG